MPVVAYGALVPAEALVIPRLGWINLHFSLLPAWRGAAPVQHAILHGDPFTGASVFQLEIGLDTGPVFGTAHRGHPAHRHRRRPARAALQRGRESAGAVLDAIEAGRSTPMPQAGDDVSPAPKINPEDAEVRWTEPAFAVDRRIRAGTPEPGAWTTLRGERVKLGPVTPVPTLDDTLAPGQIRVAEDRGSWSAPRPTPVELGDVRAAGKKPMRAGDWARGARLDGGGDIHSGGGVMTRPIGGTHPARHDPAAGDRPPRRPDPVDPARRAAYEAIAAVHRDDAYANLALPAILRDDGLHGRDAAFATELTYGTLRTVGTLDKIIEIAADRGAERIDHPIRDALRMGVYQLLYTRVPAHAAASSTVNLVRAVSGESGAGFANAVMRAISQQDLDEWLQVVAPDEATDRVGYLAVDPPPSTVDCPGIRRGARWRPG